MSDLGRGLPEDGEFRIGQLSLPAGRRVLAGYGSGGPVAWVTNGPVDNPGPAWSALLAASPETGLVPFLVRTLEQLMAAAMAKLGRVGEAGWPADGESGRPWDNDEFNDPADITGLDRIDAAALLAEMWEGENPSAEEIAEDDEWAAMIAPFSSRFPGLAQAVREDSAQDQVQRALQGLPPTRMGLARADRPADVLPLIGWDGIANWSDTALPVAAVLRSWEDRFGATLLQIGFAEISLLATRPPRTLEQAQLLAAEHFAFCDECAGRGLHDVLSISEHILTSPIWTFWWD